MTDTDMTSGVGITCRRITEAFPGSSDSTMLRIARLVYRIFLP